MPLEQRPCLYLLCPPNVWIFLAVCSTFSSNLRTFLSNSTCLLLSYLTCLRIRKEANQTRDLDVGYRRRILSSSPNEVEHLCYICYPLGGPLMVTDPRYSSQKEVDRSTMGDKSSWDSWLNRVLIAAYHLFYFKSDLFWEPTPHPLFNVVQERGKF